MLFLQVSAAINVSMVIMAIQKASLDRVDRVFVVTAMTILIQTQLEIVTGKQLNIVVWLLKPGDSSLSSID